MSEEIDIAAWWKASVHRADTHVYWAATSCRRVGMSKKRLPDELLFENYVCSIEMFLDLIKRKVVGEIEKVPIGEVPFFHEDSWLEITKTYEEGRYLTLNPFGANEHERRYRLPDPFFEYELTIDQIAKRTVTFDFVFGGHKYALSDLRVDQSAFYIYADKLNARVRFRTEWASIDEPLGHLLRSVSADALKSVRPELEQAISQLRDPKLKSYDPVCAELLRLTEKLLRNVRQQNQWKFKGDTLDGLVAGVSQAASLSEETTQMLKLVSKPYRDYVLHGHSFTPTVAKTVLATTMEAISRLSAELEPDRGTHPE
jgi:hypothetical protein